MTENGIPLNFPFMTAYKDILISYLTTEPNNRQTIEKFQENIREIFKNVPKKDYLTFLSELTEST